MTSADRIQGVIAAGFTERQARFLEAVLLHSGVCLGRQYLAHRGVVRGRKQHDFFATLRARRLATRYPTAHRRAHLYHVHGRRLYRAIGEPESRHRKPTTLGRAVERLMVLDAVLGSPEMRWLGTASEKIAYFTTATSLRVEELPHLTFGVAGARQVRTFPDKLPIGVADDGRAHVFLYGVTREVSLEFRTFLQRHAELFRALPEWEIRLLVPQHLAAAAPRFEAVVRDELARPLRLDAIWELHWYFEQRQRVERGDAAEDQAEFDRLGQVFRAPRFWALYRTWQQEGDPVLNGLASSVLADAMGRFRGRVTSQVMPHNYQHLATLVGTA